MACNSLPCSTPKAVDVVGIGFGPSNIAMAIALRESHPATTMLFFEMRNHFAWHPGMLFDTARMQVSWLKDLVCLRNPRSEFTFLNYLHNQGRLIDFVNLHTFFPTRVEFADYLNCCANHFDGVVRYGHKVERIQPTYTPRGKVTALRVVARGADGETEVLARAVVHAGGLRPVMPHGVTSGERIFHNCEIVQRLTTQPPEPGCHYVVLGGGQSAAEIVEYLHGCDSSVQVTAVVPRFGFVPADNSPFVNQIFDPDSVDLFFGANSAVRQQILTLHKTTNYGVVDLELIQSIYKTAYHEKVTGRQRLAVERLSVLRSAKEVNDGVDMIIESLTNGERKALHAEFLVCATGYTPRSVLPLLTPDLRSAVKLDADNAPIFSRSYALEMAPNIGAAIYSVGMCESTHGLSATLISNMAVRAGEIAADIAVPAGERSQASIFAGRDPLRHAGGL